MWEDNIKVELLGKQGARIGFNCLNIGPVTKFTTEVINFLA
jgi:hypothetical protein